MAVEIFKTDIRDHVDAEFIADLLRTTCPASRVSIDLEDCDKILRVEGGIIIVHAIIRLVESEGYRCILVE